jgi:arylsulfatase A-like enzyme
MQHLMTRRTTALGVVLASIAASCSTAPGSSVPDASSLSSDQELSSGHHDDRDDGHDHHYGGGRKPNVLLMVADDLGYSDIGALGGEIATPNLDALVGDGRLLVNHHSATVSAIARSMLMSGTDSHLVGLGAMDLPNMDPSDTRNALPGYENFLNDNALSLAQLLKDGGYHTYISGKWHLGPARTTGATPAVTGGHGPDYWGFEQSYVLVGGATGNHFGHQPAGSSNYMENGVFRQPGQPGQPGGDGGTPAAFYSTNFYTQKIIDYIDSNHGDGKPFFAFAAFTSPHWPLQVPEPWLSQYRGRYDVGYDAIRDGRLAKLKQLGLLGKKTTPSPLSPEALNPVPGTANNATVSALYITPTLDADDGYVDYHQGVWDKNWSSLTDLEKKAQARYMEIYAGMVSNLDYNVGRLVQHLKDIGQYEDTFIMFHSDNGAEGWPMTPTADPKVIDEANTAAGVFEALGTDFGTPAPAAPLPPRLQYGRRWAEVSSTPLSETKGFTAEGGFLTPAIVKLPGQKKGAKPFTSFTHVTDDTATILALAGITPPTEPAPPLIDPGSGNDLNAGKVAYGGRAVYPVTGHDLLPALSGNDSSCGVWTTPFAYEAYGRAAVFSDDGKWKARWIEPAFGPLDGHWQLFNISKDPGEVADVSAQHPDVVNELVDEWQSYMTRVGGVEPVRPRGYYP